MFYIVVCTFHVVERNIYDDILPYLCLSEGLQTYFYVIVKRAFRYFSHYIFKKKLEISLVFQTKHILLPLE